MKNDVLVAGEINPDLILSGEIKIEFGQKENLIENATLTVGSSSVIFAAGLVKLGLKVSFVGLCGDDPFGLYMISQMEKIGIDTSNIIIRKGGETGFSIIFTKGADRGILTFMGLIPALTAEMVTDNILEQAKHLHIASYFLQTELQKDLPSLFTRAKSFGLSTSLDTNWDPSFKWQGLDQILKKTDVFLPNKNEALAITGKNKISEAINDLSLQSKIVAVKMGEQGAMGKSGAKIAQAAALQCDVVDTIGAGDNFNAGFIFGYLNNWGLEKSLKLGIACGSLSTTAAGGFKAQPKYDEAISYV